MKRTAKSLEAEVSFRARVEELGGVVLEGRWLGVRQGHRVRCPEGHESAPQPQYIARGGGICSTCGYTARTSARSRTSHSAEADFRARVEELGGTVLESCWLGSKAPHRVRCAEGHECAPRPNNVTQGSGFCLVCTWSSQDVVYVVANDLAGLVKLGVTSGDPKPRLWTHARDGYKSELRCWRGLSEGVAYRVEQAALKLLAGYGVRPVQGREYFEGRHTPLIVDTLSHLLHPHL